MRILLIEDDRKIASFIEKGLAADGFAVDLAFNGEDGLHLALTEPYDAAIVDIRVKALVALDSLVRNGRVKSFDRRRQESLARA